MITGKKSLNAMILCPKIEEGNIYLFHWNGDKAHDVKKVMKMSLGKERILYVCCKLWRALDTETSQSG